ncbi:hypothetical protein KIN20_033260 [Parelaphostrongylus tenuis]|uniref:Uncharacterized protein n=1 Tax=Parelaphostrongylus tenuis TaxID=148309 RepID=A0AAD5R8B4_PARTN|nr:hypothetical protein KIN20_033260 [Parelaphostrongylus tenuis]
MEVEGDEKAELIAVALDHGEDVRADYTADDHGDTVVIRDRMSFHHKLIVLSGS